MARHPFFAGKAGLVLRFGMYSEEVYLNLPNDNDDLLS
jgi:hypothetical protein